MNCGGAGHKDCWNCNGDGVVKNSRTGIGLNRDIGGLTFGRIVASCQKVPLKHPKKTTSMLMALPVPKVSNEVLSKHVRFVAVAAEKR